MTRLRDFGVRYSSILMLALLWELSVRGGLVSPTILPPLSDVLSSLARILGNGTVAHHGWLSLSRLVTGLFSAIVIGVVLGLLMGRWRPMHLAMQPFLNLLYPMPKSALVPLMMIIFGLGDASKIVLIFAGCLLPVVMNTYNGARGVDPKLIWSAQSLGASRMRIILGVLLPAALPDMLNGIRTAIAFSFILLVNAELIFGQDGLGYLVGSLGSIGEYPTMFAALLVLIAIGFLCDRGFGRLVGHFLRWRTA